MASWDRGSVGSSPRRHSPCCDGAARSRPRPARRNHACLSLLRFSACLAFPAARSRASPSKRSSPECARRAARSYPTPCAPTCLTGYGNASRLSTAARRRCELRRACSIPRRSTFASISHGCLARRRASALRWTGWRRRPLLIRQPGCASPASRPSTAMPSSRKASWKSRTRAASFSPGCLRRAAVK